MAEDLEELKEVLKRVVGKILATEKILHSLNFQIWIVIMSGYYLIIAPLEKIPVWLTICYWTVGTIVFIYITRSVWRRVSLLISEGNIRGINVGILISWIIASILGWFLVPSMLDAQFLQRLAVGLLSFLSLGVLGMMITIYLNTKRIAIEMIPAAAIPALLIPAVFFVKGNPMDFAGMCAVFSYGTTVIIYIYRAFKVA